MSRTYAYLAFAIILAVSASPAHADIYKYVDDEGVIHFSNVPAGSTPKVKVVREESAPRAVRPDNPPAPTRSAKLKNSDAKGADGPVCRVEAQPLGDDVPYADIINAKCDKYGVEPSLVKAVIKAESNFNPTAVSPKGARGLMQLMPSTAADMGVSDSFDPDDNIDGGVRYLRFLLDNFGGDVELSVAAYNCGQGRVIRSGNCVPEIAETKNYVKKVLKLSDNPLTGMSFTKSIYKIELKDGSIMFTDSPISKGTLSLVN